MRALNTELRRQACVLLQHEIQVMREMIPGVMEILKQLAGAEFCCTRSRVFAEFTARARALFRRDVAARRRTDYGCRWLRTHFA